MAAIEDILNGTDQIEPPSPPVQFVQAPEQLTVPEWP
jgi:hypothetical protein